MKGFTIQRQVHFKRGRNARKVIHEGPPPEAPPEPDGRVPRISKLMALAIRFERLIKAGEISDQRSESRFSTGVPDSAILASALSCFTVFVCRADGFLIACASSRTTSRHLTSRSHFCLRSIP